MKASTSPERCANSCGAKAKAWYCVVYGNMAEPEFAACSLLCAEEWARFPYLERRLPAGHKVVKLEDF